jgi:methionyl aminopeptidase
LLSVRRAEPIVCEGRGDITICGDGWTAMTVDGGRSAQFEHTIAVLPGGIEVLTAR